MKVKTLDKPSQQEIAKKELSDPSPVIVLFHKEGCPACEACKPAWNTFKSTMAPEGYRILEIEQEAIPLDVLDGIHAFPTYAKHDEKGASETVGAITEPSSIKKKLKIS